MAKENMGAANHILHNYSISPKEAWWRLCPGSNTIDYLKADKSNYPRALVAIGYVIEPICDLVKLGMYTGVVLGATKGITEIINSQTVQNCIDSLF